MSDQKNHVAQLLRDYAQKVASEGSPDRMTVADGQGGISTNKPQIPKDPGEADLKQDQPANAAGRSSAGGSGAGEKLTVADGQGGITTNKPQIPKDPGEAELKQDQPANAEARKSAAARVAAIHAAIFQANPSLAPAAPAAQKSATANDDSPLSLSKDVLAKVAHAILSCDEGVQFTFGILSKQAGAAAAQHRITEAIQMASQYEAGEAIKSAAFNGAVDNAEAIHRELIDNGITEADADSIIKTASLHQQALLSLEHPMLKAAYAQSMDDAAVMEGADEAAAAGEEGAPPVDEALPMGGEQLGEEDIIALLQQMIDSGEITEEDVAAALQSAGGEGGEDPAAGGAPPEGDPAAADPAAGGAPPMM